MDGQGAWRCWSCSLYCLKSFKRAACHSTEKDWYVCEHEVHLFVHLFIINRVLPKLLYIRTNLFYFSSISYFCLC